MEAAAKTLLQQSVGIGDEELSKLDPRTDRFLGKIFGNIPSAMQYRIVAEVTHSKYCFAGIKAGDRIVFDPFLNGGKTTCPLCPRALLPLLVSCQQYWERFIELADRGVERPEEINDTAFAGVAGCLDPGIEYGGLGHVAFSLYSERIDQ